MKIPTNYFNLSSYSSTPLKIIKSIGWVALAILALPSSLVGYRHSRLFLGKAVAVWNKNQNPTVNKTHALVKNTLAQDESFNISQDCDLTLELGGEEKVIERLKTEAQQDGQAVSRTIQDYGIKSEGARYEIACIAAQQNGRGVSKFIRNYGIENEGACYQIARIAAQQNGRGVSEFIQNYGIENEEARYEIACIAANQDGKGVSEFIQNYGIENEEARYEIACIAANQDGKGVSEFIRNYEIKNEEDRIKMAKQIANGEDGWVVKWDIDKYEITNETIRAEIENISIAAQKKSELILKNKNPESSAPTLPASQMQAPSTPSTSTQDPVSAINVQAGSDLFPPAAAAASLQKKAVKEQRNIKAYANEEWNGESKKAVRIRNGYSEVCNQGFTSIRKIRGDNYCGLRSTLFQAFRQGIEFPSVETLNRLNEEIGDNENHWLLTWNFNNAQHDVQLRDLNTPIEKMQYILSEFERVTLQISSIESKDERTAAALLVMNREIDDFSQGIDPKDIIGDAIFMEALKLHMMANALDLHKKQMKGDDVPDFTWCALYARGDSENPEDLFRNYINTIGYAGGAEQAEMHLLGHTLGKPIKVARLSSCGEVDFISVYPEVEGVNPELTSADEDTCLVISAEDDRHYNVITTEQQ